MAARCHRNSKMADVYKFVFFIPFLACVDAGCVLSLNSDFGNPSPIYLRNDRFLSINYTDEIILKRSDIITVACPGSHNYVVLDNNPENGAKIEVQNAKCVNKTVFQVGSWKGEFRNITCKTQPWTTVEDMRTNCHKYSKLYRIGYVIKNKLYSLYKACFDTNELRTRYTEHILKPSKNIQSYRRTSFLEGGVFQKVPINKLYQKENQIKVMGTILGGSNSELYNKKQALTRGHLAPRADFPFRAEMRATFQYINTAPQWKTVNAGDWAALESAIRKRVNKLGHPVTIYTGTHGVLTLPNKDGVSQNIYLHFDGNNNGVVPVPLYFYKVLYNQIDRTAVAFITINSSFYNKTTSNELQFCGDICESNPQYSWLQWRERDGAHSFCCDYKEFIKTVDLKLNVTGRFYS